MTSKQIQRHLDKALQTADDDLERDCLAALAGDAQAVERVAAHVARERNARRTLRGAR